MGEAWQSSSVEKLSYLSDVRCGHTHAELLCQQPGQQGCNGDPGKTSPPRRESLCWATGLRPKRTLWAPDANIVNLSFLVILLM